MLSASRGPRAAHGIAGDGDARMTQLVRSRRHWHSRRRHHIHPLPRALLSILYPAPPLSRVRLPPSAIWHLKSERVRGRSAVGIRSPIQRFCRRRVECRMGAALETSLSVLRWWKPYELHGCECARCRGYLLRLIFLFTHSLLPFLPVHASSPWALSPVALYHARGQRVSAGMLLILPHPPRRIASPTYIASEEDALRARARSTAIIEKILGGGFDVSGFTIFDWFVDAGAGVDVNRGAGARGEERGVRQAPACAGVGCRAWSAGRMWRANDASAGSARARTRGRPLRFFHQTALRAGVERPSRLPDALEPSSTSRGTATWAGNACMSAKVEARCNSGGGAVRCAITGVEMFDVYARAFLERGGVRDVRRWGIDGGRDLRGGAGRALLSRAARWCIGERRRCDMNPSSEVDVVAGLEVDVSAHSPQ
ncbi:hypothetical protein B0H16DRAFT_1464925 [Mycena metata]|uniref:Uncharacterized protein n=1 Tax=Mycena metata TaxID=1033252 RepID=A0AAD7N1L8_9AGAR|nr:hypothetical protein B0H16DRAFT_1464925 [Mycena metata]